MVGDRLHVVMGIVHEQGVIIFRKLGVVSSMGDRHPWVGGVVVHERGVDIHSHL
jgi:hypothetical protein